MNDITPFFESEQKSNALVEIESSRAIEETRAAMIIAKKFPRDQNEAYTRIMKSCERPTLAKEAMYAYPRGGQMVTGPSVRLAEAIAQCWGNLQFGIRELSQANGESEVEAFAWDIETNTRQVKVFKVPHKRHTRKGAYDLTDPRDIYELTANMGARRLRACILGVIPGDIIDAAVSRCNETLKGGNGKPLEDRVRDMMTAFDKLGVSKEMIEERIGHNISAIIEHQLIELGKIHNSIKDGMSKREDWFNVPKTTSQKSNDLTEKLKKTEKRGPVNVPEADRAKFMLDKYEAQDNDLISAMFKMSLNNFPAMDDKETLSKLWEAYNG